MPQVMVLGQIGQKGRPQEQRDRLGHGKTLNKRVERAERGLLLNAVATTGHEWRQLAVQILLLLWIEQVEHLDEELDPDLVCQLTVDVAYLAQWHNELTILYFLTELEEIELIVDDHVYELISWWFDQLVIVYIHGIFIHAYYIF